MAQNGESRGRESHAPQSPANRSADRPDEQKVVALAEQWGVHRRCRPDRRLPDPSTCANNYTHSGGGDRLLAARKRNRQIRRVGISASGPKSRGRSAGKVDAPGKKYRPPPSQREKKLSDDRVAKLRRRIARFDAPDGLTDWADEPYTTSRDENAFGEAHATLQRTPRDSRCLARRANLRPPIDAGSTRLCTRPAP